MASTATTSTRRGMVAALALAPVALAMPASAFTTEDRWEAAAKSYSRIEAEWVAEFDAWDAMECGPGSDAAYDRFNDRLESYYRPSREKIMALPAPHIRAVAQKMEWADPTQEEHFDAIKADITRLALSSH